MERRFLDVLIIGGGPAGAATAILCARFGLDVAIIEREQCPHERPGEILHPGIEPLLFQLDVWDDFKIAGFLRHSGTYVKWEKNLRFEHFGQDDKGSWMGFQVWRPDFDTVLLNHAKDLGVEIIRPCNALRLIIEKNRIVGIETSKEKLHSSFVIDCAGSQHWIAKQLGIDVQTYSPRLLAHFGYMKGNCEIRNDNPSIHADKQGWIWTAKIRPNLYQWVRLSFENISIEKNWVPEEFNELEKRGGMRGEDVTWRIVSKPAGPGYFITGDACSVLDPASSHGVLKAMMSGMMAAHMISKITNDESLEKFAIQEYSRWIKEWFLHDVKRLKELYSIHPFPPKWVNANQTNSKNELNSCILPEQ